MLSCDEAGEVYATERLCGETPGGQQALRDHARECEQDRWYHALPAAWWPALEVSRERMAAVALLHG